MGSFVIEFVRGRNHEEHEVFHEEYEAISTLRSSCLLCEVKRFVVSASIKLKSRKDSASL